MSEATVHGFPKGNVAQTLRKILYPDLTDHEVEAIVVCLMAHLLLEKKLNGLIFRWMMQDAPRLSDNAQQSIIGDDFWKNIIKLDFAKKYKLVEPFFNARFPEEAENIWKINDLRNDMFHGRAIRDAQFKGKPISDEVTVEHLFLAAQYASWQLDKFEELVDIPHAYADRWKKRLLELGESLY